MPDVLSASRRFAAALTLVAACAAPALAADMIGNCELVGEKGQFSITPAVPGQLTVEFNPPAPGWWNGDSIDQIKDGFEYCLAANIAHRIGVDKVGIVPVAWDALRTLGIGQHLLGWRGGEPVPPTAWSAHRCTDRAAGPDVNLRPVRISGRRRAAARDGAPCPGPDRARLTAP